jgi:hypothetical protein
MTITSQPKTIHQRVQFSQLSLKKLPQFFLHKLRVIKWLHCIHLQVLRGTLSRHTFLMRLSQQIDLVTIAMKWWICLLVKLELLWALQGLRMVAQANPIDFLLKFNPIEQTPKRIQRNMSSQLWIEMLLKCQRLTHLQWGRIK